jgi:hypothetical protein
MDSTACPWKLVASGLRAALWAAFVLLNSACGSSTPMTPPATVLDREPPQLLNAFFGLDDALPPGSRVLCRTGPGRDGMPVTFSRRVMSVDPSDFVVVTRSGVRKTPACATLRPADGALERHTVLLIGDPGSAQDPQAGMLVDPRGDLNPSTSVTVSR